MDPQRFEQLVRQVQDGYRAEQELVLFCQKELLRLCHIQLRNNCLRKETDPEDISQSVLRTFLPRLRAGEHQLAEPGNVQALLNRIASRKIALLGRRDRLFRMFAEWRAAKCREDLVGNDPLSDAMKADLMEQIRLRVTEEEWQLIDLRGQGYEWKTIAALLGDTDVNLRQKFRRALKKLGPWLDTQR